MKVKIEGRYYEAATKADLARKLLTADYSVSAIAKAVPMAYSQAHSIAAQLGKLASQSPERIANIRQHTGREIKPHRSLTAKNVTPKPIASYAGGKRPTSKARVVEAKVWAAGRVDLAAKKALSAGPRKKLGKCINCGFELIGQKLGGEMQFTHTGGTAEDYVDKIQFCHAYPASLGAS